MNKPVIIITGHHNFRNCLFLLHKTVIHYEPFDEVNFFAVTLGKTQYN